MSLGCSISATVSWGINWLSLGNILLATCDCVAAFSGSVATCSSATVVCSSMVEMLAAAILTLSVATLLVSAISRLSASTVVGSVGASMFVALMASSDRGGALMLLS